MTETNRRRHVTPYLAGIWCLAYLTLGTWWALGGAGFPLGAGDPDGASMGSWLPGAQPLPTGVAFAAGGAAGLVALITLRTAATGRRRAAAAGVLVAVALPLLLVLPDVRILQNLAYSFGGYFGRLTWPVVNQALCALGGVALIRTAMLALRRPPCATCGRIHGAPADITRWTRIGRWAVTVAVAAPLPYALQRGAWFLGIPLGVDRAYVVDLAADMEAKGVHPATGFILVVPELIGALLTLGLIMRWGERFPRWTPFFGGRPVPVLMAVIPASVVAFAVTIAGIAIYRFSIEAGHVSSTAVPGLFWLPWGIALATATVAYARRRGLGCPGDRSASGQLPQTPSSSITAR